MTTGILYKLFFGMAGPARADLINFEDLTFVSDSSSQGLSHFHTLFGSNATGYAGAGFYQQTSTGPAPAYALRSNASGVLGVYDGISFSNFGQSAGNGGIAHEFANLSGNSADLTVAGGFNFDSIDLRATSLFDALTVSVTGYDASNHVLYPTVQETSVLGWYRTFTFNWQGVSRVHLAVSGSIFGSNQVYIDNLHCHPAPEPSTIILACFGVVGMIVFVQRGQQRRNSAK
jgi:hypothetical protein